MSTVTPGSALQYARFAPGKWVTVAEMMDDAWNPIYALFAVTSFYVAFRKLMREGAETRAACLRGT